MEEPVDVSVDAFTDLLLAIYDECSQPLLKKEKPISDFLSLCTIP